VRHSVLGKDT